MAEKKHTEQQLVEILRTHAQQYLRLPNVTSVGVGFREKGGKVTKELCIQFSVARKLGLEDIAAEGLTALPESIEIGDGATVPVDVLERSFKPSYEVVLDTEGARAEAEALQEVTDHQKRRTRQDTVQPGLSVSNVSGSAGTLGAIVYDRSGDTPYMLSNWHVLAGPGSSQGDTIVQPGPYDNAETDENRAGTLVRSHLGLAGDCAVASIEERDFDEEILGIGVQPKRAAKVNLGDPVVKSGRTTGVTYGIVRRVGVVINLNYGGDVGTQQVGGFEIGPNPDKPAANGEISMGGDSGSLWMLDGDEDEQDIAVGLHFAGETDPAPSAEHAVACNIHSVLEKLDVDFVEQNEMVFTDEEMWNQVLARLDLMNLRIEALEDRVNSPQQLASGTCGGDRTEERPVAAMAASGAGPAFGSDLVRMPEGIPVYGNWCGPGHGGGNPVDDVDRACQRHDRCYGRKGYFDCTCDAQLLRDLDRAIVSGNVRWKGRVMAPAIRAWFTVQPCVYHVGGIPIPGGTGGIARVTGTVAGAAKSGVKGVVKGGKKLWKKVSGWF